MNPLHEAWKAREAGETARLDPAALLREAIDDWPEFDTDSAVDGSDLVDWFAGWRQRAVAALASHDARSLNQATAAFAKARK